MSAGGPLSGLRVGITRAESQSAALAVPLRARGAVPVAMPTLTFADPVDPAALDAALAALPSGYDGVLLTSTNAVARVAGRLSRAGRSLPSAVAGCSVATAGTATAEALRALGVSEVLVPTAFRSEGILALLKEQWGAALAGSRWLMPRAREGRDLLAEGLRASGATVDLVAAYRTVPPADSTQVLGALEGGLDVITFTSGSAARNLERLVGPLPVALDGVAVASLGPVTSEACRALGIEPAIEPAVARVPALVEQIVRWAGSRAL